MQHLFSMHASAHSNNYRQAYVLLLFGFVFLTLAWPGMFHSFSLGVGVTEYLQAVHLIPSTVVPFALSLWLPGFGLSSPGLVSLAVSGRTYLAERMKTNVHHGSIEVHPAKEDSR